MPVTDLEAVADAISEGINRLSEMVQSGYAAEDDREALDALLESVKMVCDGAVQSNWIPPEVFSDHFDRLARAIEGGEGDMIRTSALELLKVFGVDSDRRTSKEGATSE